MIGFSAVPRWTAECFPFHLWEKKLLWLLRAVACRFQFVLVVRTLTSLMRTSFSIFHCCSATILFIMEILRLKASGITLFGDCYVYTISLHFFVPSFNNLFVLLFEKRLHLRLIWSPSLFSKSRPWMWHSQ